MLSKALIIPAAGSGKRLQRETPKPFIELAGQPILAHTVQVFLELRGLEQIVVAAPAEHINRTERILKNLLGDKVSWQCIKGGAERQHSIFNALQVINNHDLVLVHDAVRPFVSLNAIETCCRAASEAGAAVLGIPAKDTIKKVDAECMVQETPDRRTLWQIQTPQIFKTPLIKKAYEQARGKDYVGTDDASLVEWMGHPVKVVKGNRLNFKITYPHDLAYATMLLKKQNEQ